jgi:beta-galactosidase GanA
MKAEKAGNLSEEFYGFYDGLSRNHILFDVIDEEALKKIPPRCELIILPNAACLSNEVTSRVRDFVKNGGNIISTFETSLYSETGLKQDNFQLNDVFGAEYPSEVFGPLNWDYLTPSDNEHFSLINIKQKYLNAPSYGLITKAKSAAPVMFCKPLHGSYSGSPVLSNHPFIIDNSYGKGRSLYLAGTFGGSLNRFHFPEYYMLLFNMVSQLSTQDLKTENIPSSVEVNMRKKVDSIFLYLINFTSEMRRPIQRIIPVYDLKLELATNITVKGIRALWSGKDMEFVNNGGSVSFKIPSVENYEVLEIRT